MDIGKILFNLSYVKYKHSYFSLLVNDKSLERKDDRLERETRVTSNTFLLKFVERKVLVFPSIL